MTPLAPKKPRTKKPAKPKEPPVDPRVDQEARAAALLTAAQEATPAGTRYLDWKRRRFVVLGHERGKVQYQIDGEGPREMTAAVWFWAVEPRCERQDGADPRTQKAGKPGKEV